MGLVVVDPALCNADGVCVAECPAHIIELNEGLTPNTIDGTDDLCIDCGHCVAVCPTGALTHRDTAPEGCATALRGSLAPEQVENLLCSRRSIRTYREKAVGREVLAKLIDIARYAPSSHNSQLVGWQIIYRREDVKRLAEITIDYLRHLVQTQHPAATAFGASRCLEVWDKGLDNITLGAPHIILAHHLIKHPYGAAESAMALSYVDLASRSLGLGACYLGYVWSASSHWPPLQQALSLPENRACFGVLAIGHPEYEYSRIPPRKVARVAWR